MKMSKKRGSFDFSTEKILDTKCGPMIFYLLFISDKYNWIALIEIRIIKEYERHLKDLSSARMHFHKQCNELYLDDSKYHKWRIDVIKGIPQSFARNLSHKVNKYIGRTFSKKLGKYDLLCFLKKLKII